jgi:thiol-disulfide isomerase/thioredoxin
MRILIIVLLTACFTRVPAQQIRFIKSNDISNLKSNKSDTIYVINFWATWCKPCVEELPYFEQLNQRYANKKVKVLLVSNDFKKQIDKRLKPFIASKKLQSTVLFMDESNPNDWINNVDETWSGAIPATLIVCGSKSFHYFHEGEITKEQLENIIRPLIQ